MRFGVSAGELKAIVDNVYAHAGSEYLADEGQRVTYSRLAVITGINRAFLPGLLTSPQDEIRPRSNTQLHRAARVLNGWHDDKLFQTKLGDPATLQIDGKTNSFRQLVELYSGGVYHRTMLSELERVGAIRRIGAEKVKAIRRAPIEASPNLECIQTAGDAAGDLLNALEHNLSCPENQRLPMRSIVSALDPHALPHFRAELSKRTDALVGHLDQFMREHKASRNPRVQDSDSVEVGAAVVAIMRVHHPTDERPFSEIRNPKRRVAKPAIRP